MGLIKGVKWMNLITRRTLGTASDNPYGFGFSIFHPFSLRLIE